MAPHVASCVWSLYHPDPLRPSNLNLAYINAINHTLRLGKPSNMIHNRRSTRSNTDCRTIYNKLWSLASLAGYRYISVARYTIVTVYIRFTYIVPGLATGVPHIASCVWSLYHPDPIGRSNFNLAYINATNHTL